MRGKGGGGIGGSGQDKVPGRAPKRTLAQARVMACHGSTAACAHAPRTVVLCVKGVVSCSGRPCKVAGCYKGAVWGNVGAW